MKIKKTMYRAEGYNKHSSFGCSRNIKFLDIKRGMILHEIFETAIFLKGLNGIFQLIVGVSILFISIQGVSHLANMVFQHELSQEPTDKLANISISFAENLSLSTKDFIGIYVLLHGLINLFIFLSLWKEKHWAYPVSAVIISLMIIYQIFRFSHTHSLFLLFVTILDIIIVSLLLREYHEHWKNKSKK